MKTVSLKSTDQVCDFFNLLALKEKGLLKELDILLKIAFEKEAALNENNFDKASEMRMKELKKIQDIVIKLNERKILNQNILTIKIAGH